MIGLLLGVEDITVAELEMRPVNLVENSSCPENEI
jgi:hypothetical protein